MFENVHNVVRGTKKNYMISSPQISVSLNTDKSAVLATAKGNKTTGGPDSSGVYILGPLLDILQWVRTTGLSHIFLFFSFFTLTPFLNCKRCRWESAHQRTSRLAQLALCMTFLYFSSFCCFAFSLCMVNFTLVLFFLVLVYNLEYLFLYIFLPKIAIVSSTLSLKKKTKPKYGLISILLVGAFPLFLI